MLFYVNLIVTTKVKQKIKEYKRSTEEDIGPQRKKSKRIK